MVSTDDIEIADSYSVWSQSSILKKLSNCKWSWLPFDVIQEVILEYAKRNKDLVLLVVFMLVFHL
jgi:hypothetical protein